MSNSPEKDRGAEIDEDIEEDDEEEEAPDNRPSQSTSAGEVDLNALAEKVYQRLRREVLVERERRTGRISD